MLCASCVYSQITIFEADFENNSGDNNWTFNGGASDGNWLRGQPTPYNTGSVVMEISAQQGSNDLLTGNNFSQDVDLGPTSARSSSFIIPSGTTTISFSYYFSYYFNSSSQDYLSIELRDQNTNLTVATLLNDVGDNSGRNASWANVSQDISAYTGSELYIFVESADLGNPSKVEAAIDDISIVNINTGPPTTTNCTQLIYDDFESGLGNWNDPGSDCARINNSNFSSNGNFSLRLRDNSNTSNSTSNVLDLSLSDTVIVEFSFMANSMEVGEDFWLQMSTNGGASFTLVQDWISGVDFSNNIRYYERVEIVGPLTSNTRFRFVCDATANGDQVYFDEISISSCEESIDVNCPILDLTDSIFCKQDVIQLDGSPMGDSILAHLWTDLGTGSSSGYSLSNITEQVLTIDGSTALSGGIDLVYTASTATCSTSDTMIVQLLSEPLCEIIADVDTICSGAALTLEAVTNYLVTPDSGMVVPNNSGVGFTQMHQIIGVQDPASTKIIVTLPTWDDHFDTILLNGQMIIPEIFETASYNANGMNCTTPWIANVNGLPRSILEITENEVRYFSSLTTTSTVMTEVFPTNWVTTPQPFIEGTNNFQFGIQNTNGPVSGSWFIEAIGTLGYSYLWSTGDTTDQITIMPTMSTNYQLTVTSPTGCQSFCEKQIEVVSGHVDSINYNGCSGDGYGIVFDGVIYDESNPTDTIIVDLGGCDSVTYINLVFAPQPVVDAGSSPSSLCSNGHLILSDLNASISGSTDRGVWTSIGGGTFDNGGDFGGPNPATQYTPSPAEIELGKLILTLTSEDPEGSCEPDADAVMVPISDVRCSNFPWTGNN